MLDEAESLVALVDLNSCVSMFKLTVKGNKVGLFVCFFFF